MKRRFSGTAAAIVSGLAGVLVELARIVREMLSIPAHAWLAAAEVAGLGVLAVWDRLVGVGAAAYDHLLDALEWAERRVRPVHGVIAVCLAAIAALGGSQLLDYRGVSVGVPAYSEVETVAPAPEVDRERPASAHGPAIVPIAAAALALVLISMRRRRKLARLLTPLGLAVVAISLAIDAPRGLDAGGVAVAYEGAEALLLEGFWAQLAAGAVLACCGPLLAARLRPAPGEARDARRRPRRVAAGSRGVANAPMGGQEA